MRMRRGDQPATKVIFTKAHMAALIRDNTAQHFRCDGIGMCCVITEYGILHTFEYNILGEYCGFPVTCMDEIEQTVLEFHEATIGTKRDLGLGIADAELAEPVKHDFEVASLVDDLCREEDFREAVWREADHAAGRVECRCFPHAVVA